MHDSLILAFDTETNDAARSYHAAEHDVSNWPRIVQLGWVLADSSGEILSRRCELIVPAGWKIDPGAGAVHGITVADCEERGKHLVEELTEFAIAANRASVIVAHNIAFDWPVISCESLRCGLHLPDHIERACTMELGTRVCRIPGRRGYKWPRLAELHRHLFGRDFDGAHDASADADACMACYLELMRRGWA